jgi:hypothetical protein
MDTIPFNGPVLSLPQHLVTINQRHTPNINRLTQHITTTSVTQPKEI